MTKYVTAYEVTRHFGGPEEGGWWWNANDLIETVIVGRPATPEMIDTVMEALKAKHQDKASGDIYSVLGGTAVAVYVEDLPGENTTTRTPHYE